jgi:hypothetical protein
MDQGIAVLIVGGLAFASPVLLTMLQGRTRRAERVEDFARQDAIAAKADAVAEQAAIAAKLLHSSQQLTIAKTDEVAAVARTNAADTASQLKQIHTLVNSDMTAARQGELDQTKITLVGLNTIIEMAKAMGHEPTAAQLDAVAITEKHIIELEAILADRLAQMKIVEAEIGDAAQAKELSRTELP